MPTITVYEYREWTDEDYAKVQIYITESLRLAALSKEALVKEAVERGLVDDPLIEEIVTRLDPEWAYREEI